MKYSNNFSLYPPNNTLKNPFYTHNCFIYSFILIITHWACCLSMNEYEGVYWIMGNLPTATTSLKNVVSLAAPINSQEFISKGRDLMKPSPYFWLHWFLQVFCRQSELLCIHECNSHAISRSHHFRALLCIIHLLHFSSTGQPRFSEHAEKEVQIMNEILK